MKDRFHDTLRIALAPIEIAGYLGNLKKGFDGIGITCDVINLVKNPFYNETQTNQMLYVRLLQWLNSHIFNASNKYHIKKVLLILIQKLFCAVIVPWVALRYNVIIFGFARTFTDTSWELRLYRLLRIKLIFIFLGSDSRPPFIGIDFPVGTQPDWSLLYKITRNQKNKLKLIERYADYIINIIPQSHFHERIFINGILLGLPYKVCSLPPNSEIPKQDRHVRILHSPSKPAIKGTQEIIAAIESLRSKGYPIEFIKIQGMPNAKVLEEIQRCDFIVDELYSDTPMAGFAAEAAHFGKPAVVCSYFAPQMRDYYQEVDIPPSLFVHPDQIESAIEKLLIDVDYRLKLGKSAYEFIRSRWMPEQVAERYLRLIKDDIPDEWWCDPKYIRYLHGCGLPEWRAKELVRGLVEHYGIQALQLSDKPELEKSFLQFAGLSKNHNS